MNQVQTSTSVPTVHIPSKRSYPVALVRYVTKGVWSMFDYCFRDSVEWYKHEMRQKCVMDSFGFSFFRGAAFASLAAVLFLMPVFFLPLGIITIPLGLMSIMYFVTQWAVSVTHIANFVMSVVRNVHQEIEKER